MTRAVDSELNIRHALASDAETLLEFIQELADYEREPDAVQTNAETLRAQLGQQLPPFHCLIAEQGDSAVGFALYFFNYSTWRGRRGLYLEDLFVLPEYRRHGVGLSLLRRLAQLALQNDCARMEWSVLDWNQPAIDFYQELGAVALDDWTTFRLTDGALAALARSED